MSKAIEKAKILIENAIKIDNELDTFLEDYACENCPIMKKGQCEYHERCGAFLLLKKLIYIHSGEE